MDSVIKHLIDIDKKAHDIVVSTDDRIKGYEKKIHDDLRKMREQIIDDAKKKAEELKESEKKEAEAKAKKIRSSMDEQCIEIDKKYQNIKDHMKDTIFKKIISTNKRDNIE